MSTKKILKQNSFLIILPLILLSFSACSLQTPQVELTNDPVTDLEPEEALPTETPTSYLSAPADVTAADYDRVSFWFGNNIASSWTVEFVPQGPGSSTSAGPVEHTDPDHFIFMLDYYPVAAPSPESQHRAKIYIYPAPEMSEQNPTAATRIAGLKTYLESPPENLMDQTQDIPFLPLFNAAQVFHTQVKFLEFQNGSGVRYLTMYSQGPMPIVNAGIFYTFQGLTDDGQYYVAAYLPVNNPSLKTYADEVYNIEGDAFMTDPVNYINGISEQLDRQPSNTFTPELAALDAMIETLLVRP